MLEIAIPTLGNPGSLDITDKSDPLYYVARVSHEQSQILYNLNQAGFKFKQMEDSDVSSFQASVDSYLTAVAAWYVTAVQESNDGDPISSAPTVPALPNVGGVPGVFVSILLKIAVHLALKWLEKKLDPNTEAKEIAQILKQALIGTGTGGEYPILDALANVPLEIIINRKDDYQDITYETT